MKQIHFFNTNLYFRHYFIGSFRELPVLPWLTEEKQIMQLLHLRFYCQRQLQPSYQLTNLAALWRPLPVFPFTLYNLEACFQEDTVMLPKTSIAFLFHKKEEPNLQKKLYQILHFIFFYKSGIDCIYVISLFPKHPLQWLIHHPLRSEKNIWKIKKHALNWS